VQTWDNGKFEEIDLTKADGFRFWQVCAARNRDEDARRMTPSQLEKAQDLSRKCVQKNYKGC
jgi:hypothetical protein